ncbi:GerAB/ArcD/ProY family transporter [Fictibacillus terranigra]|uniref:Endospore germination permease n=1 Tax=Fictibacillus terranigra TaxID=3058424 RepID=A0ABT8E5I0_9BACL|nr:endospore germination permease [Fictibacillus sp. CENA-BCM004]MDN4073169.1 endospore germination permease [Fictibacillus sp. CENA-BCM004]
MIEKGKISSFQMALIMYPTIAATALLTVPGITGSYAERDMWISPILGSVNGFFTAFILYQLHRIYPKESLIQYVELIIGRFFGKILGFVYLFFLLHLGSIILREYSTFVSVSFLQKTPPFVIIGGMILVCAFAVSGGIEVLGRTANLFVPIVFLLPLITAILLLKDFDPKHMLPIMEHGSLPVIMGAAAPQVWFGETFLITLILPFLSDRDKGMKWSMILVIGIMVNFVITNLTAIFLFGGSASGYAFPLFTAIRYITVSTFFEHLESVAIAIWIMGIFIKVSMFYYALVLGTSQWLNLSDYRPIVFPFGFLLTVLGCQWVAPNFEELNHFLVTIYPFYGTLLMTLIPVLLLLIAWFRKKQRNKEQAPNQSVQ